MTTTVREVLDTKGRDIWSVGPDATVYQALVLMAERSIGALLVLEGGRPVGLLSERDYARKVILAGRASRDTPVRDVMTTRVVGVAPERTVEECMALMTDKRVRHLPVMEGERLLGVVSIGDLVKAIIAEQRFIIEQLESYISG
ncbi:CBS domain containing membrane protein [Salinisphaera sp. PC39]|uniref:CBS domain-containing protein n=1 Tax=Salinisphaera sp. PC39 TaxID=1304156 RepID=UPI00333E8491